MRIPDEVWSGLMSAWHQNMKSVSEETEDKTEMYIRASYELYELLLHLCTYLADPIMQENLSQILGDYETIMDRAGVDFVAYKWGDSPRHTFGEKDERVHFTSGIGDDFFAE